MKKLILGHSPTPAISKGAYQVGTTTSDLGYNKGPVMWINNNAIILPNGRMVLYSNDSSSYYGRIRRREAIEHTRRKLGLL